MKSMGRNELLSEMKKLKMSTKDYFQAKYAQRLRTIAEQVKVNTVWRSILDFKPTAKRGAGKIKDSQPRPQLLRYDGSFVGLLGFRRSRDKLSNSELSSVVKRFHIYEKSEVLDKIVELTISRGATTLIKLASQEKQEDQESQKNKPSLLLPVGVGEQSSNLTNAERMKTQGLLQVTKSKPGDTLFRASQESYLNLVRRGSFNPQILETIEEKTLPAPGPYQASTLQVESSKLELTGSRRSILAGPLNNQLQKSLLALPEQESSKLISNRESKKSILIKLEKADGSKSVHESARTIKKENSVDSGPLIDQPKFEKRPSKHVPTVVQSEPPQQKPQTKKPQVAVSPPPKPASKLLIEKFLGKLAQGQEKFVFKMSDRSAVCLVLAYFTVSKEGKFVTRPTESKPTLTKSNSQLLNSQASTATKTSASVKKKELSSRQSIQYSKFSKGSNK